MLANLKYWELDAQKRGYAIPHFNVWNIEMLQGAMEAATETNSPVILSFGTGFFRIQTSTGLRRVWSRLRRPASYR